MADDVRTPSRRAIAAFRAAAGTVQDFALQGAASVAASGRAGASFLEDHTDLLIFIPIALAIAAGRALEVDWSWLLAFVAVATIDGYRRRGRLARTFVNFPTGWRRLVWSGVAYAVFAGLILLFGVVGRLQDGTLRWQVASAGALALGLAMWTLGRTESFALQAVAVTLQLLLGPALVGWIVVSSAHGIVTWREWAAIEDRYALLDTYHTEQLKLRRLRETTLFGAEKSPVAVTLSGGGYRAALTQAGSLWALEESGVPIRLLSTVSGGSIIGAAYALGWKPEEFVYAMCRHRPGLRLTVLNAFPLLGSIFPLGWNSGDTYALHFEKAFFQNKRLGQTGPPTLILNATRYENGDRAAFWPSNAGQLTLARGVAASGAFPAAFDPVKLRNPKGNEEHFIDGGVVENLGIDGLWIYLRETKTPPPSVLIVLDVSAEPSAAIPTSKPSLLAALLHAQAISYQALHRRIFDVYSEGEYTFLREEVLDPKPGVERREAVVAKPFRVPIERIWPFRRGLASAEAVWIWVVRPTGSEERGRFGQAARIASDVADLSTLTELAAQSVTNAVWIGARAMAHRIPDICDRLNLTCDDTRTRQPPSCADTSVPDASISNATK